MMIRSTLCLAFLAAVGQVSMPVDAKMSVGQDQSIGSVTQGSFENHFSETTTRMGGAGVKDFLGHGAAETEPKKKVNSETTTHMGGAGVKDFLGHGAAETEPKKKVKTPAANDSGFEKLAKFHGELPTHSGGKCGEKGLKFSAEMVDGVEVRPAETLDQAYYCNPKLFCSTYSYCTPATKENAQYYSKEHEQFNKEFYMTSEVAQKEGSSKSTGAAALIDTLKKFIEKHANGEHAKEKEVSEAEHAGAHTSKQFMETIAQALHAFAKYIESSGTATKPEITGSKTDENKGMSTKSGKKSTGQSQMEIEAFLHQLKQYIFSNDCQGDDLKSLKQIAKGGDSKSQSSLIEEYLKRNMDPIQSRPVPQLPSSHSKSGLKPFVSHKKSSAYYKDDTTEHREKSCKGEYCYFTPGSHFPGRQMHRGTTVPAHPHSGQKPVVSRIGKGHGHSRHNHGHNHDGHGHGHDGRPRHHGHAQQSTQYKVDYKNTESIHWGPNRAYPNKTGAGNLHKGGKVHTAPDTTTHATPTGEKKPQSNRLAEWLAGLKNKPNNTAQKELDAAIKSTRNAIAKLNKKKTSGSLTNKEALHLQNLEAGLTKMYAAREELRNTEMRSEKPLTSHMTEEAGVTKEPVQKENKKANATGAEHDKEQNDQITSSAAKTVPTSSVSETVPTSSVNETTTTTSADQTTTTASADQTTTTTSSSSASDAEPTQ
ncbi:hypothetical protein H4R34_001606 [Dimargaris verticillata]|uniref:Uncharacterized protein n=1 Tax=Dimargaris verticillata TaxID=2761393 RepID=A0A9W8EDN0_9FUNG|nr:hypothetical protein H4R34_001606 [Dimargaris verticillata]